MRKPGFFAILCIAAFAISWRAEAQRGFGGYELPEEDPSAFKIITPPYLDEAMRRLSRLRNDLGNIRDPKEREIQVRAILTICQEELDREVNAVGVVAMREAAAGDEVRNEVRRWLGAYNAIEAQIRGLGKDGLLLYEQLYGKRAENLLLAASVSRDLGEILDVNKRFGMTQAGVKAATLAAQIMWEEGRLSPAARALERALEFRELLTPEVDARVSAWLGRCYRELGERANLAQLRLWTRPLKDAQVDVGGKLRKLDELLGDEFSKTRDATNDTIEGLGVCWPGGNYANTGIAEAPTPPDSVAWSRTLPRLEADRWDNAYMLYNAPIVPPYLPVSDGTMLYVNTGDALVGYDVLTGGRAGGEPLWRCKPYADGRSITWRTCEPDPSLILPVSVWKGTVFAPLENPMREPMHRKAADNRFGLYSHYPQARRSLCAVDGETGRLLWKVGGQYEGDDFDQSSFGPAVVHEGTLYAIGTRVVGLADIMLYALDPTNGVERWHMRLCYGQQETTMFGRPARWPFTSLPAIAGGELFVCTNIGGVVAVNLERRALSWIAKYDYMCRPMTNYIYTYYRPVTWFNSPTMYAEAGGEGYVICAPADSQKLMAYNARTGELAWELSRAERDGQDYNEFRSPLRQARALVGVRNGVVLVGGASSLYSVDLASGKILRTTGVFADRGGAEARRNELQGWPALAGNKLLWPGLSGITEVDLDTWRSGRTFRAPSGANVSGLSVFVQQGITFTVAGNNYSAGNVQVAARFDANLLLTDARLKVANFPDDPEAALRYGLLNLRMGDRVEAQKWLQKAFALASKAPVNSRVQSLAGRVLVSISLESCDAQIRLGKFLEALGHVEVARGYATLPTQLTECFVRQELCLLKRSEGAALRRLYQDLIDTDPPFGVGADPEIPARLYASIRLARIYAGEAGSERKALPLYESLFSTHPGLSFERVSLRQLGIQELGSLLETRGREFYADREEESRALFDSNDRESRRKVMHLYPHSAAADAAALALANLLLSEGNPVAAAQLLKVALDEIPKRPRRGELLALLAIAQGKMGEALRARLTAMRALREYPAGELEFEGRRASFKELLSPLISGAPAANDVSALPRIATPLTELWEDEWQAGSPFVSLPAQPAGMATPAIIMSRYSGDSPLFALNPADGSKIFGGGSAEFGVLNSCLRSRDDLLLVFSRGLIMIDMRGRELWRTRTQGAPDRVDVRDGMVLFATRVIDSMPRKVRVSALDAATGLLTWDSLADANDVLWIRQCGQGVLVITSGSDDRLLLLDLESGKETRRLTLSSPVAQNSQARPFLLDDRICYVDERGFVSQIGVDDFALKGRISSGQIRPNLFAPWKGMFLVLGYPGAALCDVAGNKILWRAEFKSSEQIVERAVIGEVLVVATRQGSEANTLVGVNLSDGKRVFEERVEAEEENDVLKLKVGVALQDGAAFGYAITNTSTGMSVLRSFRLIVVDSTGKRKLDWSRATSGSAETMSLAAIDGYIVLTADRATICFGAKE